MSFEWEKWINAAMGIIRSHNNIAKKEKEYTRKISDFIGLLDLIKRVGLSRPMLTLNRDEDYDVMSNLPGLLNIRTAWSIFDARFCQFEFDQWMDAYGPLPQNIAFINNNDLEYAKRKSKGMKTSTEIAIWARDSYSKRN